ncbi:MAG TPA: hypothetical protein VFK94_06665 [Patescibacteria group bacterium]|nr:hypothetical protein [Patescibacteria group bacterium]
MTTCDDISIFAYGAVPDYKAEVDEDSTSREDDLVAYACREEATVTCSKCKCEMCPKHFEEHNENDLCTPDYAMDPRD